MNRKKTININYPHKRGRKSRSRYASAALCTAAVAIALCAAVIRIQKDKNIPTETVSSNTSSQSTSSKTESDIASVTSDNTSSEVTKPTMDKSDNPKIKSDKTPSLDEYEDFEDSEQTLAIQTIAGAENYVRAVGGAITKDYCMTSLVYSRTMGDWRVHKGLDISATKGEIVKSAGEGTVTGIIQDPMYGTTVVVNQNDGLMVYYRGMNKDVAVKEGENISAGTTLGTVGEIPCESGDGSHLHLEVMRNKQYLNPAEAFGYK